MKRTVVIHQPDFLPWLGFFHRLRQADLYVALDHVRFVTGTSRSWTHRDRIKTASGPRWLSLHVRKTPLGTAIRDIPLAPDNGWRSKNLQLVRESYRRAAHFDEVFPRIEALYARRDERLMDMTLASIAMLSEMLGTTRPVLCASGLSPAGSNNAMLADLLAKTGATDYLSGLGARAYFDPAPFARVGIKVHWQAFLHPVYPQQHGEFVPYLSAIDMLLNCGVERSREILGSC